MTSAFNSLTTRGQHQPVFIIAEAGVNHNGDEDRAIALVHAAADAGATCVKFQTFSAERVASATAEKAPYQRVTTRSTGGQAQMLKSLELPARAYAAILDACRSRGIAFLSTPYSPEDVDFLETLGVDAYKIASAQIIEPDFLKYVAARQKPVLLSTGMATMGEVESAVEQIRSVGNNQLALLQCTTNYPSVPSDAQLRAMDTMRRAFAVEVGYSDHTSTLTCCIVAVALGATIIERHLTLDRNLPGPDHRASSEPAEFSALVDAVREAESALGDGRKTPAPAEVPNGPFMRRSLVARHAIVKGELISRESLTVKRPGTGIPPARLDEVIGKRARVAIAQDALILWADLEQ